MKIDALSTGCRADENTGAILLPKSSLGGDFCPVVAAAQNGHALPWKHGVNLPGDQVHCAKIGREHDHFFLRILTPEHTQARQKLIYFGFTC